VGAEEGVAAETLLDRPAALRRVDLVDALGRRDHLVDGVDHEAGPPVLDDLGHGAEPEGDHRRTAGERLDHHEAEGLRPLYGEQRAARPSVQLDLGLVVDLTAEVDGFGEVRLDLAREVLALEALVDLAGHDQPDPEPVRDLDGRRRTLLGVHAADEEEVVVLLGAERLVLDVDGVRDGPDEPQVGEAQPLVLGDGDEGEVVAQAAQHVLRRPVRRTVQRRDDRSAGEPVDEGAHHPAVDAVVVVDDVELASQRVGLEALRHLEVHPVLDQLEGGALEEGGESRPGRRVAAREQCHLVTAFDEAFGEQ